MTEEALVNGAKGPSKQIGGTAGVDSPKNTKRAALRLNALLPKGGCEQLDLVGLRERRGSASRSAGG
jgi:hypothetical protein